IATGAGNSDLPLLSQYPGGRQWTIGRADRQSKRRICCVFSRVPAHIWARQPHQGRHRQRDAAVSACTAAITSGQHQATDLAIAHIIRGNAYINKGDYNAAAQDYDEAIRLNPKNAAALYNRGNIFFRLGRYDEAIKNYDKAIELKPDYAIAFNNRCF